MWGTILSIGSYVVEGVTTYFTNKQELSKVELETKQQLLVAETQAKITKMLREAEMDYDLDKQSIADMKSSWKDEALLVLWCTPIIMCFLPDYQPYVVKGFEAMELMPDWFKYLFIGMVITIYGMRGLFKLVLQAFINKNKIIKSE